MAIKWTRAAHKHGVTRDSAWYVMASTTPTADTSPKGNPGWKWTGPDTAGIEIEIVAAIEGNDLIVIHAMPTAFRTK